VLVYLVFTELNQPQKPGFLAFVQESLAVPHIS
ncbi:uncharacterized protein METZ01_LOCUS27822, partial [marine metagenome]